jgi:hypothetical protein
MKRSIFLLITSIISLLFGGMMLLVPDKAAEGFGIISTPETLMLLRGMGEPILAMGVLNFLVRNDSDSNALKSIFILNVLYHALGLANDFYSVSQEIITLTNVMPGIVVHLFIGIGSIFYITKMKISNN